MKSKSVGMRPRTLRSGILSTPATLHLEITMLLHQERRLNSELEAITARAALLRSYLDSTRQRIDYLRNQSDTLDPEGRPKVASAGKKRDAVSSHRKGSPADSIFEDGSHSEVSSKESGSQIDDTEGGDRFRHMPLSY